MNENPSHQSHFQGTMIGRDRELTQLLGTLDNVITGSGRLVLISGEAGIGKTMLINALARHADEGDVRVFSGGCYDLSATSPYALWKEVVLVPQQGDRQSAFDAWRNSHEREGPDSQAALFESIRQVIAAIARQQPVLIILEDLHWSDSGSVECLRYLGRTLQHDRVLIGVTYRDDEPIANSPFLTMLPSLVRETSPQRIALQRLSRIEIETLVANHYRMNEDEIQCLTSYVHRLAEGVPYYALEILLMLEQERILRPRPGGWQLGALPPLRVPQLLRQTVAHRLNRLGDDARKLLEIAAVVGHEISIAQLFGQSRMGHAQFSAVIDEIQREQLVDILPDQRHLQFRHALIRQTVYEEISPIDRLDWHREAADYLCAISGHPDPDLVAWHLEEAGDKRAFEWLIRAADRARANYAWNHELHCLERADRLALDWDVPLSDRGWLLLRTFRSRDDIDLQTDLSLLDQVYEIAHRTRNPALQALTAWTEWVNHAWRGIANIDRLEHVADQIRTLSAKDAEGIPPRLLPVLHHIELHVAKWAAQFGRYHQAIEIANRVSMHPSTVCSASTVDRSRRQAMIATVHSLAFAGLGRPEAARTAFDEADEIYRSLGDTWARIVWSHTYVMEVLEPYFSDDANYITGMRGKIEALWMSVSVESVRLSPAFGIAPFLRREGDWTSVRKLATEALQQQSVFRPYALHELVSLNIVQGNYHDARNLLDDLQSSDPDPKPGCHFYRPTILAQQLAIQIELAEGNLGRAKSRLVAYDHWHDWSEGVVGMAEGHLLWARYLLLAGDRQRSRNHAERALRSASEPRQPLVLIAAHRLLGKLSTLQHDFVAAKDHLTSAAKIARACRVQYELTLTELAEAELALAMQEPAQALPLIDRVITTCKALEAQPALIYAEKLVLRANRQHGRHPAGLTSREIEILVLIAEGLSNRAMADRLSISVRTVERHVTNIYRKADVHSRVEAANYAQKIGAWPGAGVD